MSKAWPMVALGDVVAPIARLEAPIPGVEYRQIGVRFWGAGAYERETIDGGQTKYKTFSRVEADDIIVNKIWARNGSVAVVSEELSGCYASGEFPIFAPDKGKLDSRWIHWQTKTKNFWEKCDEKSRGTSGKNRIRPERFLEIEIPLPPLSEQKRITARLEELSVKIEEARGLRREAVEEADALWHAALKSILNKGLTAGWTLMQISEVAETNPSKQSISTSPADMQVSFVPMSAVDDITGTIKKSEIRHLSDVKKGYTYFAEGDVIFAKITPCMQNGKSAIAKGLKNGIGFGSTEFHVMRPKSGFLLSEWLYAIVRHKDFKDDAAAHFKGTAGQQRVPQSFLAQKTIPVPPFSDQRRIVAYLDDLQAKVDALKRLQTETASELNAMLPSVLDRAFKGELA